MIPAFFLALVIIMLFGANVYFIILVIGLTMWPRTARIMRAQVLSLKNRQYVQASRVSGASHLQALFLHVAPNGIGPVITQGTILMGVAILIEAALSFLGLGDPTTVSWGRMIFTGQEHLRVAPWMGFFPGLVMLILVCALNLVGDGLNAAINPHTRERSARAMRRLWRAVIQPEASMSAHPVNGVEPPLLEVRDLHAYYALDHGVIRAVDGVSLTLRRGESLGLVGESGCGKTSLGLALMRTLPTNARVIQGEVYLAGEGLLRQSAAQFQRVRWKRIAMIFQSSMNSLNPVKRVGDQLLDAYRLHRPSASRPEAHHRLRQLFEIVGIPAERLRAYPHELSGGMRQRVIIALALLLKPEVIIADEPTTALDVLVKDQILAELDRLRTQLNLSMILISHDMGVVAETCDRIAVMYAGQIVEEAPTRGLFQNPRHPYTRGLIGSLPTLTGSKEQLVSIPGDSVLPMGDLPPCRFAARCPGRTELCVTVEPPWVEIGDRHRARCHYAATPEIETVWKQAAIA
jgi:peptide/nickel transport system permease protein